MKSNKYQPYIRLATGREKASSWREAIRLAFYRSLNKPFYVMVQRGFPNLVIAVHKSKRDICQSILAVMIRRETFRTWSSWLKKKSNPKRSR